MKTVLCSACLLGIPCRYDGVSKPHAKVLALRESVNLIPVCPEESGGLPTPRQPAELQSDGRVRTRHGTDVTEEFRRGAQEVLRLAKNVGAEEAILKQRSPSCGCGQIYDGSFGRQVILGDGVATALLKLNGIRVISENEVGD
jgi:uncharacterized protein YbbK (DUF523 family)